MGGFVGQSSTSEFVGNETRYSIQGNTRTYIGGFGGRMDSSTVSRNIANGPIGGNGSK